MNKRGSSLGREGREEGCFLCGLKDSGVPGGGAMKCRVCQGPEVKGVSVRTTTGPHSELEWAQERAVVTTVFH